MIAGSLTVLTACCHALPAGHVALGATTGPAFPRFEWESSGSQTAGPQTAAANGTNDRNTADQDVFSPLCPPKTRVPCNKFVAEDRPGEPSAPSPRVQSLFCLVVAMAITSA